MSYIILLNQIFVHLFFKRDLLSTRAGIVEMKVRLNLEVEKIVDFYVEYSIVDIKPIEDATLLGMSNPAIFIK